MSLPLILGSSSVTRQSLLPQLGVTFSVLSPDIDETPQPNEGAEQLVQRLSLAKAHAIAAHPDCPAQAIIIAADQVVSIDGWISGKAKDYQQAVTQLSRASGKTMVFYAGLCVLNTETQQSQYTMVPTTLIMRTLSPTMITHYLDHAQPFHCAGSMKIEHLGIALVKQVISTDPTALLGLPLISLSDMLINNGVTIL